MVSYAGDAEKTMRGGDAPEEPNSSSLHVPIEGFSSATKKIGGGVAIAEKSNQTMLKYVPMERSTSTAERYRGAALLDRKQRKTMLKTQYEPICSLLEIVCTYL